MSYTINAFGFIWVRFYEEHGIEQVKKIIDDVNSRFEKELRCKILIDTREAEITDKIFSITEVMSTFEDMGASRKGKTAVLRNPTGGKYQAVMKSVADAGGHNFKIFTEFEEAVLWLNEEIE